MSTQLWHPEQLECKKWTGQSFTHAQIKLDGWRATFYKQPRRSSKQMVVYGKDHREHLEFLARFPRLNEHPTVKRILESSPPQSMIETEIVTDRRESVTSALRDSNLPLRIVVFAIPWWNGVEHHETDIDWASTLAQQHGLTFAKTVKVEPADRENYETCRTGLLLKSKLDKTEGWVLKDGGQYKRWYKLKHERTVDAIITGTIPGQGKYQGQVGALVVSVYDGKDPVEIASCSGMTDYDRMEMTKLGDRRLVGRVVEVEYQMVGSQGRLTHPRFVRFRDDKPARKCTKDQLE